MTRATFFDNVTSPHRNRSLKNYAGFAIKYRPRILYLLPVPNRHSILEHINLILIVIQDKFDVNEQHVLLDLCQVQIIDKLLRGNGMAVIITNYRSRKSKNCILIGWKLY